MLMPVESHDPKCHVVSHFDNLGGNKCNNSIDDTWHHMTMTPVPIALHGLKCYVELCFSHHDLMGAMVLVTMPLASLDAYASFNSVKCLKNSCCTSFQSS